MDDALSDVALAGERVQHARLRSMIDQHKSGTGYIATSNDGKPAARSDEDLQRLEKVADASRADIEAMEKST